MILYINSKNEIKDVDSTNDVNLTPIEVDNDTFKGWSVAKICCYKLILQDGCYCGFTPYVDSRVIEHIDRLALEAKKNADNIIDVQLNLIELYNHI